MTRLRIADLVVIVIAVFETFVQASYYLDDTDSSIIYLGSWAQFGVTIGLPIDQAEKLYNGTETSLDCYTKCRATMAIPFDGSGITLYSVVVSGFLFNVSIDGAPPTSYHIDEVLGCCNSTIRPLYNYTFYSVSSLPLGHHTLLLTALDPSSVNMSRITLGFDYAFVDSSDNPKPTTSTSDIHPSTTSASAKSKSRSVIGPAIGGAVGGILIIFITIVILTLFWKRRQTRRGDATLTDPDANTLVSTVDRRPIVGAGYRSSSTIIDPDPNIDVDRIPIVNPSSNVSPSAHTTSPNLVEQPPLSRLTSASLDPDTPHSSSTLPVSTLLPSANRISKVNDTILTAPGQSSTSDGALAAQEARFLRHLYDRNAPAEEIAELMQAMQMRAREGSTAGMATSKSDS